MSKSQGYMWFQSPLMLLLIGIMIVFYPTWSSSFLRMQTDPGDTRYVNFQLEWVYQCVSSLEFSKVWDPPVGYPQTNTLSFSDTMISLVPFYAPFRVMGFMPDTSYQLWMITMMVLNYVAFFLFLKRNYITHPFAASAGAYLFTFSALRVNQLGHMAIANAIWAVLLIYAISCLLKLTNSSQVDISLKVFTYFLVAACCLAFQFYAGFYVGYFITLSSAILVILSLIMPDKRKAIFALLRHWRLCLIPAFVFLVIVWPLATKYIEAAASVGGGHSLGYGISLGFPQVMTWVYQGESFLYEWLNQEAYLNPGTFILEHRIGFGLITLMLSILGLVTARQAAARIWLPFICIVLISVTTVYFPLRTYHYAFYCSAVIILFNLLFRGSGRHRVLVSMLVTASVVAVLARVEAYYGPGSWASLWSIVYNLLPGASAIRATTRIAFVLIVPMSLGYAMLVQKVASASVAASLVIVCVMIVENIVPAPSYDKHEQRCHVKHISTHVDKNKVAFYYIADDPERYWYRSSLDAMWAALESGHPTINLYSGVAPQKYKLKINNLAEKEENEILLNLKQWIESNELDENTVQIIR